MARSLLGALGLSKRRSHGRQGAEGSETRKLRYETLEHRRLLAITVANAISGQQLVNQLLGAGVTATNVQLTYHAGTGVTKGAPSASAGTFTGGKARLGIEKGVILSSGGITNVIGPNTSGSITQNNGLAGDAQLTALAQHQTYDATILEFDFVPASPKLTFRYVFSSDEYLEYVDTQFNDVFAFYLNGANVALVPGTATPVSINNVSHHTNTQYFINNTDGHLDTEMDGLTVVMKVKATVLAGQVNHIKLAIADSGDSILDSNVFIEAGSFRSSDIIVTGVDAGQLPWVNVFDGEGAPQTKFLAYENTFRGGVRVAVGDVTGDGTPDIIVAPGPGRPPEIHIFQGYYDANMQYQATLWTKFMAWPAAFTYGGLNVGSGDVNGDKVDDVVVGAGPGSTPTVRVFNGTTLTTTHALVGRAFTAMESTFRGGVTVTAGDFNGDGQEEVAVGRGPGGQSTVNVYTYTAGAKKPYTLQRTFNAFKTGFTGGVYLATGDANYDKNVDLICSAGAGWMPQVNVYDGTTLLGGGPIKQVASVMVYDLGFRGGVRVTYRPGYIWVSPGPKNATQNLRVCSFDDAMQSYVEDAIFSVATMNGSFIA
jgi:hypothetical protein